jgi:hypothetical protein
MFSNAKKRLTIVTVMAVTIAATSVSAIAIAGGDGGKGRSLHGGFTSGAAYGGPDCPSPIDLCADATFTGSLRGPATAVATSLTPTAEPGVVVGVADIVIHDRRGDVRCTESFVLNTTPGGDSEEGWICRITGGTGRYANASGHIEAFGSARGGGDVGGTYGGRLTFP